MTERTYETILEYAKQTKKTNKNLGELLEELVKMANDRDILFQYMLRDIIKLRIYNSLLNGDYEIVEGSTDLGIEGYENLSVEQLIAIHKQERESNENIWKQKSTGVQKNKYKRKDI